MLYKLLLNVKQGKTRERFIGDFVHYIYRYTGAISYADDIILSCPSIRGLNRMQDICNKFAAEHYLIFNSKKSLAIKYGNEVIGTEYAGMRLGFGQNSGKFYDTIDSNPIQHRRF